MKTKICNRCKTEKTINEFGKSSNSKDGLKYSCKICLRLEYKIYALNNKDKIKEKQVKLKNTEILKRIQERSKSKRHARTKLKFIEIEKEKIFKINSNLQICFDCKIEKDKKEFNKCKNNLTGFAGQCKNCKNSKHQLSQKTFERKTLNKEEVETKTKHCPKCSRYLDFNKFTKSKNRRYGLQVHCKECRLEYHNKVSRKIHMAMAVRVRNILKHDKMRRKTFDLVGYTKQQLMEHLEMQFDDKMTWKNYGTYWHIDHIIPVSYYEIDSAECESFRLCWRLENLRPLEASENMRKSSKVLEEFQFLLENNNTN